MYLRFVCVIKTNQFGRPTRWIESSRVIEGNRHLCQYSLVLTLYDILNNRRSVTDKHFNKSYWSIMCGLFLVQKNLIKI